MYTYMSICINININKKHIYIYTYIHNLPPVLGLCCRFQSEGAHGDPVGFNDLPPANPEDMDDLQGAPDEDPEAGLDESDEEEDKYPGCVEGE
jgi:hypothetical protein